MLVDVGWKIVFYGIFILGGGVWVFNMRRKRDREI